MALRHALATLAILLAQSHSFVAQTHLAPMLEIRVSTPKWVNECLDLTIERVNTSPQTVYLPEWEPVYFFLSTRLIRNDRNGQDKDVWLLFYGLSDIVDYDAREFPAGSKTTDHFCLPERFVVVNQQQKTRRHIDLRGHIKIVASYFPTEEDWKTSKAEQEKHMPTPWHSPSASSEILVPCSSQSACVANCKAPPPITEGEGIVVPDVFQFHKDWNERGKTLEDTLSRKYSACKD